MVRAAEKKEMENRRRFPAVFEGHDRLRNILVRNRRTSQKKSPDKNLNLSPADTLPLH